MVLGPAGFHKYVIVPLASEERRNKRDYCGSTSGSPNPCCDLRCPQPPASRLGVAGSLRPLALEMGLQDVGCCFPGEFPS